MRQSSVRPAQAWAAPAVSGIAAVAGGLVVGELMAHIIFGGGSSPFQAIAAAVIDGAPAPLREWAIDTFGTNNKRVLQAAMLVVIAALAAAAGVLEARRPRLGVLLCLAFGVVGAVAAVGRLGSGAGVLLPPIVAGIAAAVLLIALIRLGRPDGGAHADDESDTAGWERRRFLGAVGLVAVAAAGGLWVARSVQRGGDLLAERMGLRLPSPTDTAAPVPAGVHLDIEGATPFVTDNDDFYRIDTAFRVPQLSTADWQLRIHGMVERELTFTWDDLQTMAAEEKVVTLTCVSNEVGGDLVGNARWLGYAMRDLLDQVGVHPDADMLLSTSVDGWTAGTPLSAVTDGRDALLAIGMNGEPLPFEHGYPVRQVVPGLYGYVSATKWVVDWEITRFDRVQAYWTQRGWAERGPIKTASRIDRPAPLTNHPAGRPLVVAGTAWAQGRGIAAVEVRIDDGPWQQVELATEYSTDTWRQWSWTWQRPEAGNHTVYCRATDGDGERQPEDRMPPIPEGATGWHNRVLRIDG